MVKKKIFKNCNISKTSTSFRVNFLIFFFFNIILALNEYYLIWHSLLDKCLLENVYMRTNQTEGVHNWDLFEFCVISAGGCRSPSYFRLSSTAVALLIVHQPHAACQQNTWLQLCNSDSKIWLLLKCKNKFNALHSDGQSGTHIFSYNSCCRHTVMWEAHIARRVLL